MGKLGILPRPCILGTARTGPDEGVGIEEGGVERKVRSPYLVGNQDIYKTCQRLRDVRQVPYRVGRMV